MAEHPLIGKVDVRIDVNESWEGSTTEVARENFVEWLHESITNILDVDIEILEVDINGE